jgi:hypothetical protein
MKGNCEREGRGRDEGVIDGQGGSPTKRQRKREKEMREAIAGKEGSEDERGYHTRVGRGETENFAPVSNL